MHRTPITRLFGMLLMLYSTSFLPSIGVAVFYQDGQWSIFVLSLAVCLLAGLLIWFPVRQLFQMAHPQAISVIKLGRRSVPDDLLFSIWGFYTLYIFTCLILTVAMMGAGLDLESAFGAVTATITLLGPGLRDVATDYSSVNAAVKWLGIFAMLIGRLEVFTLLTLFLPAYWRN